MENFREYLDSLCHAYGVRYAELGRRVGLTKSYIGQIIHGHSKPPPPDRCEQLADAIGASPAERRRLTELAVRERAKSETRTRLEELEGVVRDARGALADVLIGLLHRLAAAGEAIPQAAVDLFERDELLADLFRLVASGVRDPRPQVARRLTDVSPERLVAEVNSLAAAAGAVGGEGAAAAARPPVPLIGYVAAGETNVAFTDAGLPAGVGLPGEEPVPRWQGLGEHAYALRIKGESMMPLCPPGSTVVVDPDRTPREGEPAICQTTEDKTYFKLLSFEPRGGVRLVSTNPAVAPDIVLARSQVRWLQKVVATIYP
jgi:phage repressor protein C with HTH and peptisase S24 domain/transcriptional regulator with XRE-family HTH domain